MTYLEMKEAVIMALANKNDKMARELYLQDAEQFKDIIDEIYSEVEMGEETISIIKRAMEG